MLTNNISRIPLHKTNKGFQLTYDDHENFESFLPLSLKKYAYHVGNNCFLGAILLRDLRIDI